MLSYFDIKDKEHKALDNNIFGFTLAHNFIQTVMNDFKYSFNDLTEDELFQLNEINGLSNDESNPQFFSGRYVMGITGNVEAKSLELTNLYEYDLFKVFSEIDKIISNRKPLLTINYE